MIERFNSCKKFLNYKFMLLTLAMTTFFCGTAFASSTATADRVITFDDFKTVRDVLVAQFNVTTILAVISGVLVTALGLVFFWFGIRKAFFVIMSAAQRGKAKV